MTIYAQELSELANKKCWYRCGNRHSADFRINSTLTRQDMVASLSYDEAMNRLIDINWSAASSRGTLAVSGCPYLLNGTLGELSMLFDERGINPLLCPKLDQPPR
jgi:hypothetical protein